MKPLLHPSSSVILFFSVSLLILSINTPTCLCADDPQYSNCNTAFSCENSGVTDLKYPFWGGNRDKSCGSVPDPYMELTCEEGVAKIKINEVEYRILRWEYTTQMLTVARDDYWDDVCEASGTYKNSTFENSPFQSDQNNAVNVTLLYSCVLNGSPTNQIPHTNCGDDKGDVYFVLNSAPYSYFCTSAVAVVIPLLGSEASSLVSQNTITNALKQGFGLRWSGNYSECETCVRSGGVCGNNGGSGFICFCKDGHHNTTACNSDRVPSM